ncbi:F-box domain-containing protein [Mycena sanguinolenta]|uniref:F-box domain-containing protein n=1 Tax=Mycena sanguinolenta TaxID=230812 RepID=A0A8H6Z2Q5_9AGAR|nr:F-box domain-containing protein [Mycena sanguinolenta]
MPVWCSECGALQAVDELTEELRCPAGTSHYALLNSNEAPLDSELPIVESMILKIDASVAAIDKEILDLYCRIKELNEERDRLRSYRVKNRAILSPIRRLPPEILVEIFLWTTPNSVKRRRSSSRYSFPWPWVLTRISHRWREIAVSTPSLWSHVVVNFDLHPTPLPVLEAQIARAQELKIHIYGREIFYGSRSRAQIFQYLAQYSSRWEEFHFHATPALAPLLADIHGQVPLLRVLRIQWNYDPIWDDDGPVESIDFTEAAPSLVDVSIFNEFSPMPISLPAQQLTRYELRAPWDMHKTILTRAPNLVEAHIDVRFGNESWLDTRGIIDMPQLDRLYISKLEVLRYIRTPVLQGLALSLTSADQTSVVPELRSFLSRSSCTLRHLCLRRPCNPDTTIAILKSIPSLIELDIILVTYDFTLETLMENLAAHVTSESIVAPQLSAIFFGTTCDAFGSEPYVEMVESRWKSPHCALRRAWLLTDSTPDSGTLGILRSLRQEGLDFGALEQEDAASVLASWVYSRKSLR